MVVIKAGGNGDLDMTAICTDVADLTKAGEQVVLVHGGSFETNQMSEQLGHPPRFVTSTSGHVSRFTDRETLDIFVMVVAGRINKMLVEQLQKLEINAFGMSGVDGRLLEGQRKDVLRIVENSKRKILRGDYSGIIEDVNVDLLRTLLESGYTPVVAPVAISYEGDALNVDGDRVAAALASALKADTLVILSNVPGLLRDFPDEASVIPEIALASAEEYLDRYAKGRMKKKLLGAIEALQAGVGQVVLADARPGVSSPLQNALAGHGTTIS